MSSVEKSIPVLPEVFPLLVSRRKQILDEIRNDLTNQFKVNVDIIPGDGSTDHLNSSYLPDADIIFCAARAGTEVINEDQMNELQAGISERQIDGCISR